VKRTIAPLLLAALIASCAYGPGGGNGSGNGSGTASPSPDGSGNAHGLAGAWVLTDGTGPTGPIQVLADYRITLVIEGDEAGGHAACNIYGGTLTVDGDALQISALSMTEMACDEPAMSAEAAYLAAIGVVDSWERDGDRLVLSGSQAELTFELEPPVPDEQIVGTTWVLESLIQGDAATSVLGEAFVMLTADGKFTGMTGCRELRGRYVMFGDEIDFAELSAEGECPADRRAQDAFVIDVLEGRLSATVEGTSLALSDDAGQGLVYRAAPGIE
jgi:heat shock protein HslJ